MNSNLSKCYILLNTTGVFNFQKSETVIRNSNSKNLSGTVFHNKIRFEKHINTICQGYKNMNSLATLIPYMDLEERRMPMNSIFSSQSNYYPVILMLHSRALNNKTNRFHERCLRVIYTQKKTIQSVYTMETIKHLQLVCIKQPVTYLGK